MIYGEIMTHMVVIGKGGAVARGTWSLNELDAGLREDDWLKDKPKQQLVHKLFHLKLLKGLISFLTS